MKICCHWNSTDQLCLSACTRSIHMLFLDYLSTTKAWSAEWSRAYVSEFLGKTPYVMTGVWQCRLFVVRHKMRQSYIWRIVWPRMAKFYMDIHADQLCIHTGYDVTSYFRSEIILKKTLTMLPPMASGFISRKRFKRGSGNVTALSGTFGPTNAPDIWHH